MVVPSWLRDLTSIPDVKDVLLYGNFCQIDRGLGLETIRSPFRDDAALSNALMELAFDFGARLDIASPIADLTIGHLRLHLMVPFGVATNSSLSVRVHQTKALSLTDLHYQSMISSSQLEILQEAISLQKTIVICGATSSGKTTLLRALLNELDERVITIEQTPELFLPFPAISLFSRESNQEGLGAISLNDLVVHSLRMRPDRVVIGEVRRDEFFAFLQASSNGHRGSLTTLHATSVDHIDHRLKVLGLISGISIELTRELVFQSIDLFVQLERTDGVRTVIDIVRPELVSGDLRMVSI